MQNTPFAELELSQLMLGTVQFGLKYGIANKSGQPSYEQSRDILAAAHEGGVNCLDTAAGYGNSEEVVGQALQELGLSDQFTVITKVMTIPDDLPAGEVDAFVEHSVQRSLRRLQLQVLPLCLMHKESDYHYMESLIKIKEKGLARHIGVSGNSPDDSMTIVTGGHAEAVQLPSSLLDQRFVKAGVFSAAKERGVATFVRSVFLQGLLMMRDEEILPELAPALPVLARLRTIAREAGLTMQELAVRFILGVPGVSCVLTGVESVEQVRQNVRIFDAGPLSPDLMEAVTTAVPEMPENVIKPYMWSCKVPDDLFRKAFNSP